jgi:hypothetical protein
VRRVTHARSTQQAATQGHQNSYVRQRHVLHAVVQGEGKVLHGEARGLTCSVSYDGHNAHDVGVCEQLQRLQIPPQHALYVLVKPLYSRVLALVLDLEHAA